MTDGLSPETLAAQALGTIDSASGAVSPPIHLSLPPSLIGRSISSGRHRDPETLGVVRLRDCRQGETSPSLKRYDFVGRCGLLREHLRIDELAVLGLEICLGDPTGH